MSDLLDTTKPSEPIFILGLMHRSGTNFLHNLICLHPACTGQKDLAEDFLVSKLSSLEAYVSGVQGQWNSRWNPDEKDKQLRGQLAGALLNFCSQEREDQSARLVTKTPSVESLDVFRRFFPDARLLLVVRNGEATVESARVSFEWGFFETCMRWARSAAAINQFGDTDGPDGQHLIVRYEDLFTDLNNQLERILRFLDLPLEDYDFERANGLPVKGSSELKAGASGDLHWKGVPRTEGFDPLNRSQNWSKFRRALFSVVAGGQSKELGYEVAVPTPLASVAFWLIRVRMKLGYYAKRLWHLAT